MWAFPFVILGPVGGVLPPHPPLDPSLKFAMRKKVNLQIFHLTNVVDTILQAFQLCRIYSECLIYL